MKRKELLESREYWIAQVQLGLYEMMENYMKENALNKTQLAEKLKVSKGYISQILNGDFDHKISKLVDISLALGKVPILKYESTEKYIVHDSLNICTTVGIIKEIDFTYDFSTVQSYKTTNNSSNIVELSTEKEEVKLTMKSKYIGNLNIVNC